MDELKDYQALACRTESYDWPAILQRLQCVDPVDRLLHAALGMSSELAEFAVAISAHSTADDSLDVANIIEELGDLLWYMAIGFDAIDENIYDEIDLHTRNCMICKSEPISSSIFVITQVVFNVGVFADAVKRHVFYGQPLAVEVIKAALSEIVSWAVYAARKSNTNIADVCSRNIAKLKQRYPDGFTEEAAADRDLAAERKVLEATGD